MLRVVKVRLYPNKDQQNLIHQHFGSCRFVYNILLDAKIKAYECNDNLSIYELKKRLVPMKNVIGGEFLKQMDSTALQNSIINMDKAYKNFFRKIKLGEKKGFLLNLNPNMIQDKVIKVLLHLLKIIICIFLK